MKFLILPLFLLVLMPVAHADTSRLDMVSQALDAFDQSLDKALESFQHVEVDKKQELGQRKTQTLDMGYERYFYQYWESIPIKVTGAMNGYYANYSYRPPDDSILNNSVFNAYMVEFRYASGSARYKSESGVLENDKNYNLEIRALFGKDYLVHEDILATPYLGFGYRNLYNPGNGRQTDLGFYGYDRRSFYYYLPVGLKINMPHIQGPWSAAANVEYDVFLRGVQLSDLNEVTPYINYEYPNFSNRQTAGFGVRGSFKIVYSTPKIDFYVEPFIRYWNIEDSEIKTETNQIGDEISGLEPHNTTKEIGSKIGLLF